MDTLETLEEETSIETAPEGRDPRATLRRVGVIVFGVACFFFFLLMKLPEARIQNYVLAHLRILAQNEGFLFSAEKVRVGVIFGLSLKFDNVELKSIDDDKQTLKISYMKIRPHLFSLIGSTKKASIKLEMLEGKLSGTVGGGPTAVVADIDLDDLDLSKTTILKRFLPVDLSAKLNGTVKLDLDLADATKSDAAIKLKIEKLNLPAQAVMGFNLPKIAVGESKIDIQANNGQIMIRNFEVGKDTKTDDLVAVVTGDGQLDRMLERSRLNAKAVFSFSQSVIQGMPLLDALLGSAKGSDGKYTYRLNGPLMGLEARPGG